MNYSIEELFVRLNSECADDIDTAIDELARKGIIIDRDVYFSWDTVD